MIIECPACRLRYDASGRTPGQKARCRCGVPFAIPKPAREGVVLTCPVCGAVCSPDDHRCTYCSATLSVVACPRCMGRVYIGATHCQHCGAEVQLGARSDLDTPSVRKCPRCRDAALGSHLVGETLVDECPRCSGLWIDRESFERLIKDREAMRVVDGLGAPHLVDLDASHTGPPSLGPVVYIPCPDCGELMNRKNFAQRSGVILDVCRPHGVWFDADELGKVIAFVLGGGLDEAKRREAEEVKRQMLERRTQGAWHGQVLELDPPTSTKAPKLVDVFLDGVISLLFG